jgi:hypothetical protein
MMLGSLEPVQLFTGEEPARFPVWVLPAVFGIAAALALGTWAWMAYRSRLAGDVNEHAFLALARSMRLGRGGRKLLRRLAFYHGSASPLGLIMSEHALRSALERFEASNPNRRDLRTAEQLRRALGL